MDARKPFHLPWGWAFCLLTAIAVFFLWEEHRAHILGALPYLLVLACPLIHLLMHRNHGGHTRDSGSHTQGTGRHGGLS